MPFFRAILALILLASLSPAAKLTTLAGKTIEGELVSLDDQNVVIKTGGGPETMALKDVLTIDVQPLDPLGATKYVDVQLTDGSLLHCSSFAMKGKEAQLTVLPNLKVTIPASVIRYFLSDANDPKVRKEWDEFLTKQKGGNDVLAVKKADVLNGLDGTFGDADEKGETIEFTLASGTKFTPALSRIHGMVFNQKPMINPPPTRCKVHDSSRNLLVAQQLTVAPDGITVVTVAGIKVPYGKTQQLARLDFSQDKLTFLSDPNMEPTQVEVSSAEDRLEAIRKDKNIDDGPLRLAGKSDLAKQVYAKGLVLFAKTVLVYNVGGEYKDLKFVLGTDAQFSGDSHARVVIDDGAGKELFKAEIRSRDEPEAYTVPILGVRQLRITVTSDLLDFGNHVVLADAKISK